MAPVNYQESTMKLPLLACALAFAPVSAYGGITIDPFVSVNSTKGIKANPKDKSKEDEVIKQRTTYGIRAGLSFFSLLKVQGSIGTNKLVTTQKASTVVDEYEEIDYEKDLNMDPAESAADVKITEVQRRAQASIVFDPSFFIFILRARAGILAMQRTVTVEQGGTKTETIPPITYKPTAGVGAGIKIGATMSAMAEYNFFFYKYPKKVPFEREVLVSYSFNL